MTNNIESTTDRKPQQPLFAIPVVGSSTVLDEIQQLIMLGKICPYCKNETEYTDSSIIYGKVTE